MIFIDLHKFLCYSFYKRKWGRVVMPTKSKNEECYNVKFYRLWDILTRRGMKRTDLLQVISSPTLAKLAKSESVTTEVIGKICKFLDCQPGDIMEYEPPKES